jgi:hypothetical protein
MRASPPLPIQLDEGKEPQNIEYPTRNDEGRWEGAQRVSKRTNPSWTSYTPVSFSFIIHHSLFDILRFSSLVWLRRRER